LPTAPVEQEAGWAPEPVWILRGTEKFLSPAGILGFSARSLVIVCKKKASFLYIMSHWLWSFHSRAMWYENRIRILFWSAYSWKPVREI